MINRRWGIFYFSDIKGIIDDYVLFLLKKMKKYLNYCTIIVDSNCRLENSGLKNVCDEIVTGQGKEKTFAGLMLSYISNHAVEFYDEIVLFDDSVFGPFSDLDNVFSAMSLQDVDFWGLYRQAPYIEEGKIIDSYISPFFFVLRKSGFDNIKFSDFLKETNKENVPMEKWTLKLEKLGFTFSTYYDLQHYIYPEQEKNYNILKYRMHELLLEMNFPFLPKSKFIDSNEWNPDLGNALKYLKERRKYDLNMIWHNILRIYDINQIRRNAHLVYVLPDNVSPRKVPDNKKIAVIAHFYYLDCLIEVEHYLMQIPREIDIYVTTSNMDIFMYAKDLEKKVLNKVQVRMVNNRGRDVSALLVGCKDLMREYDYICFVHDKKTSSMQSATVWELFNHNMWENNLKSEDYIYNVIELFEENPCLGVLAPPSPKHANYIGLLVDGWRQCYEAMAELFEDLEIKVHLSRASQPFAFSTTFWCRTKALKALFARDYQYEDFPEEPLPATGTISHAIERALPYIAQAAGFFSGTVEALSYASLELISYEANVAKMILDNKEIERYNAELKEQVNDFGVRNAELKEENDLLSKHNGKLKTDNDLFSEYNKKLKMENDLFSEYNKKLKMENDLFSEYNKKLKMENDLFSEYNKKLKTDKNLYKAYHSKLKEKNETLAKRNLELKQKVNEFGEYNKILKEKNKGILLQLQKLQKDR